MLNYKMFLIGRQIIDKIVFTEIDESLFCEIEERPFIAM